jgi:hypothetical protein
MRSRWQTWTFAARITLAVVLGSALAVNAQPLAPPVILNIDPASGPPGKLVTLTYSNFFPSDNGFTRIYFDGPTILGELLPESQLQFIVPANTTCGPHIVYLANEEPDGTLLPGDPVLYNIPCDDHQTPPPPAPQIRTLEPTTTSPATRVILHGSEFVPSIPPAFTAVEFDRSVMATEFLSPDQLAFTVPEDATCGLHQVRVRKVLPGASELLLSNSVSLTVIQPCQAPPTPPAPTPPPPPPTGGTSPLKIFDANNNNVIDDLELFTITDAWIMQQISDNLFFEAVDLWVSQRQIASAESSLFEPERVALTVNSTSHITTFRLQGHGIASLRVEIFTLSGQRVFAQEVAGNRLMWTQTTGEGRAVSNGLYLYIVKVRETQSAIVWSSVKKLVILR